MNFEKRNPLFPLCKPSEEDGLIDFNLLKEKSFKDLFIRKKWKSRSLIDESYCFDYVISKSNVGNKSSNCFHWQARMACDSLNSPSPIRAWHDRKLKKSVLSKLNETKQNIEKQIDESYSKSNESNETLKS